MAHDPNGWYGWTARLSALAVSVVVFVTVYGAAVPATGLPSGLALACGASAGAGGITYALFRYLWWFIAIAIVFFVGRLLQQS